MAAFSDILDREMGDSVDRPKPLPVGSYVCIVKGLPEQGESEKKKTPFVEFTLQVIQAGPDVDEEALQEFLARKDGSVKSLQEQTIRATFYTTEDALWRLQKFLLEDLKIEGNRKISLMINDSPGRQV